MFRPDGRPCYVGKGKGKRYREMYRYHNPHLRRIIRDAGGRLTSIRFVDNLSESDAHSFEKLLIAEFGRERNGGILVNDTDGGDGKAGWVPSLVTRERIRKAHTGKTASLETRAKMSAAGKGRPKTADHKRKIGRKGKVMSEQARAKMRASSALRWARPEEREKIAAFHANMTPAQRAERSLKISLSMTGAE